MSDKLRITGMASGLDVDSTVKAMMKPYNMKLDKQKQDRQVLQWQQDLYRDIIGDVSTFRSTYFDFIKPDSYMLSTNNYSGFDVSSANALGTTVPANVTATATGANVIAGNYTVKVDRMASAATLTSSEALKTTTGTAATMNTKMSDLGMAATSSSDINITFNGTTKKVTIKDTDTISSVISAINTATGGNVTGRYSELTGRFELMTTETGSGKSLSVDTNFSPLKLNNGIQGSQITDAVDTNYVVGESSALTVNLSDGSTPATPMALTINPTDKISDVITNIENLKDGSGNQLFDANFDVQTKKFSIVSKVSGKPVTIDKDISKLNIKAGTGASGQDALVTITPQGGSPVQLTKATNSFSIDGINYNLTTTGTSNIAVSGNTQKVFDKIKGFIDKYNEIIDKIDKKIEEKKQYKYAPLTDDQRKEMKDDDIKAWESKAKEGLLRNDTMLNGLLDSMRSAFFQGVEGSGISLQELGLSTSDDTSQRGKIVFDQSLGGEQALKDAIKNRGQQVANLFMKQTSSQYTSYSPDLTSTQRAQRNSDEGIFQRINDIMQDYVRTQRDVDGKKGMLIEKAGIKGDYTEFNSILYKQMSDKDKVISDMTKALADRENKYYLQFSKLEQAMNQLNSQSSWLSQQLGSGQ